MNLLEDPTPIFIVGGIAELALAVAFWRSGRVLFLAAMAGVLLLCGAGWLVGRLVVTERERVSRFIDDASTALLTNQYEKISPFIAPEAKELHSLTHEALQRVEFLSVNISRREITLDRQHTPPRATVELDGVFGFNERTGLVSLGRYPATGKLTLEKRDGRWLAVDYEMERNPLRP